MNDSFAWFWRKPAWKAAWRRGRLAAAALLIGGGRVLAADTNAPLTPEQAFEGGATTYNNWIEFSAGGFFTSGSRGHAEERHHIGAGPFGGIEDFHFQEDIAKNTPLTIDGRALFDQHDYRLGVGVTRESLGYVRLDFENFRTWYDSAGGFYRPAGLQYALGDDAFGVDRGEVSLAAGLTLKDLPRVEFQYTHRYRDGEKSSTIWGPLHPLGGPTRAIYPGSYHLEESAHVFEFDVKHRIQSTDVGLGLRYERADLEDSRNAGFFHNEPNERRVTDRQGTSYDLFSAHAFSETWIRNNLLFSAGFLFANLDSTFTGSRIFGAEYGAPYASDPLNGLGYFGLHGGADKQECVVNVNVLATPLPHFSIIPSVRVQWEAWDADAGGLGTLGTSIEEFAARSDGGALDVRERLDLRYSGVTNWVFYGGGEWTEGRGDRREHGGLSQVGGVGVPPIDRETDDTRWWQKYFLGARWYPARTLSVDGGGYYRRQAYEYDHGVDSTGNDPAGVDRYPAYLTAQDVETWDGNVRLTFRPWRRLSLVSRYEYQAVTVYTGPDAVSGLGETKSGKTRSHVFAQNVQWSPWLRWHLQAGFNYVLSETETPAARFTPAVRDARNDYWILNLNSGLVVDNRTDLNLGFLYYAADNRQHNDAFGLPLGAGVHEYEISARLTRRLRENLRLILRYGFSDYDDFASGGRNSYQAHLVASSLQYRF